jgi:hypothetical protein
MGGNYTGVIIAGIVVLGLGVVAYIYIKAETQSGIIDDVAGALGGL